MSQHKQEEHLECISKSIENFTVCLHKSIAETTDGNVVNSAVSAYAVLAMAAYGAKGKTKDEMRQILHLPNNDQLAHHEFQALFDSFNTVQNLVLKVANKIFASDSIKIHEKFKEITSTYFRSESETLDFIKNEESGNAINKWCAEQTDGEISDIVSADILNESTRMLLLNAVYFKGNWKHRFRKSLTKTRPFHINKTTTIEVPTMYKEKDFYFQILKELNAQIVGLPYQNEDFYMVIIVPREIDGLKNLEMNLEKINIDFNHIKEHSREIRLQLPKFKVETSIDLDSILTGLGMVEMFSDTANFNGISYEKLKVDKVMQKAFIEVNERGTKAAAVTYLLDRFCSVPPKVIVDRPFLYKIVHKNCTLFSGRIVNPLES